MLTRYEHFTNVISAIYHSIQRIEREEMIRMGGRGTFAQYLAALHRHPEGLTASQLSEICDRDKAAVSRTVAKMESQGLILRRGGGDHLYRARLMLTEEGMKAADFVRMIEKRQGIKISAPEEIAYKNGWIDKPTLVESAERYGKSPYGEHLKAVAEGKIRY